MTQLAEAVGRWEVPVDAIDVNPRQPREHFDDDKLAELTKSVAAVGVLQPILLREGVAGRFELVAGERRLRAARGAGLATIPATLRETDDQEMLPLAIAENLHRQGLNPLELAAGYSALIDEHRLTHAELAELMHVDRTHVTRTLGLLKLPAKVQRRVAAGVLSASHAELLCTLADPYVTELLADRIVAEGLSVHTVRELIALGGLPGVETMDGRADEFKARRRKVPAPLPEDLREFATELGDRLDTRVRIVAGRSRGRIIVDFSGPEDLGRIRAALGAAQGT